jgi:hypothetical protein
MAVMATSETIVRDVLGDEIAPVSMSTASFLISAIVRGARMTMDRLWTLVWRCAGGSVRQ